MMKKSYFEVIFIVIVYLLVSIHGQSQCPNGDKAYQLLQYSKAITEYEKCLKKKETSSIILEKLGDCYMILDNTSKAKEIFKQAIIGNKN